MKLYYYIEGRSELVISDNDENGYFTEIEVDNEFGNRALAAQEVWSDVASEIFKKIAS